MQYEPIEHVLREADELAATATSPAVLMRVVLGVALHGNDPKWAETFCERFVGHSDPGVRGSAIIGFGHLARRFRKLDAVRVQPLIEAGLADPDAWVRGKSEVVARDIEYHMGWHVSRPIEIAERPHQAGYRSRIRPFIAPFLGALAVAMIVFVVPLTARSSLRRGFNRIKLGMTRHDVQALVGAPSRLNSWLEDVPTHAEVLSLQDGKVLRQEFYPPWKIYLIYPSGDCDYWDVGRTQAVVKYDQQGQVVKKYWFDDKPRPRSLFKNWFW
jgi:hypothetical protein